MSYTIKTPRHAVMVLRQIGLSNASIAALTGTSRDKIAKLLESGRIDYTIGDKLLAIGEENLEKWRNQPTVKELTYLLEGQ